MPFPLLALIVPALVKAVCAACIAGGAAYCTHKVTEAYKKGQQTKQQGIQAQSQADLAKIQAAQEDNKKSQTEVDEKRGKIEEIDKRDKQRDKEIEQERSKANDPKLSEEERRRARGKLLILENERDNEKREKTKLLEEVKALGEIMKKNNQVINSTGSGSYNNGRHWIKELLTLENILIAGACYMLYQIAFKEDRR